MVYVCTGRNGSLYQQFHQEVPGTGGLYGAADAYDGIAQDFQQQRDALRSALSQVRTTYTGVAADTMQGAFQPLFTALTEGEAKATAAAGSLRQQAASFSVAQARIQPDVPVPAEPWYDNIDPMDTAFDRATTQNSQIDSANQAAFRAYITDTTANQPPAFQTAASGLPGSVSVTGGVRLDPGRPGPVAPPPNPGRAGPPVTPGPVIPGRGGPGPVAPGRVTPGSGGAVEPPGGPATSGDTVPQRDPGSPAGVPQPTGATTGSLAGSPVVARLSGRPGDSGVVLPVGGAGVPRTPDGTGAPGEPGPVTGGVRSGGPAARAVGRGATGEPAREGGWRRTGGVVSPGEPGGAGTRAPTTATAGAEVNAERTAGPAPMAPVGRRGDRDREHSTAGYLISERNGNEIVGDLADTAPPVIGG